MPIIYYDDHCIYCYNYAIWLIRNGLPRNYEFIPLKSAAGDQLRKDYPEVDSYNSVVLQEGDHLYFESKAIIKLIFKLKKFQWLAALMWLVPSPVRNIGYRLFANNRDKMWKTTWAKPTDEEQRFFSDSDQNKTI
ncbi:thiol-disulfide oxidoreductase DCC family protein [Staphylococcus sp. 11261D007BR]